MVRLFYRDKGQVAFGKYRTFSFHFAKGLVPTRVLHLGVLGNLALGQLSGVLGRLIARHLLLHEKELSSCAYHSDHSKSFRSRNVSHGPSVAAREAGKNSICPKTLRRGRK